MDTQDVSNVGQYLQELARLKEGLRAANTRKGEVPTDRKSRAELIQDCVISTLVSAVGQIHFSNRSTQLNSSFLPPHYLPSSAPLKDLEKMLIKDLQLETHHRGYYVLLRVVTRPVRMTAILTLVEDETDDVVMLQLYQQEGEDIRPALDIVREGTVCIIKEPYFKTMSSGGYGLRVDHVSDLIWLSENSDQLPECWLPRIISLDKTADDWKQEGNAAFKAEDFHGAAQKYTQALQCLPTGEEIITIKTNRSLANLKLWKYDAALEDTTYTLARALSEKSLFRAALAYYGLARFQDSHESLKLLLQSYPHNEIAKIQYARVENRLKEQSCAEYNINSMYEATKKMPLSLDNATYSNPVEIKTSEGRGRGLFTTRAIKVGELLLCEKAFTHCHADTSDECASKISMLMESDTNRMTIGTEGYLIAAIVQQLQRNPSQIPTFFALHHGSYEPVGTIEVDGEPIIDTFLVAGIVALNAFGCPLTSLKDQNDTPLEDIKGLSKAYQSSGIWIYASYINHSCYSNVRRSFIGDMQIVRATRNIPAGEELAFWYQHPENTGYKKRQEKLQHWGFECTCAICADDKKISKQSLKLRDNLIRDLKAAFSAPNGPNIAKAERVLAALEKTYKKPATEVPRLALWGPYFVLLKLHAAKNQPEKVVNSARNFFASLGFLLIDKLVSGAAKPICRPFQVEQWGLMVDPVIEVWMVLWTAYTIVAPELASMAEACAKTAYKICVGEDSTFDEKVGGVAREAVGRGVCYGVA